MGGSQGREYAELPWAVDVAVEFTLILMAIVIIGTIVHRTEKKLYVSAWYYAGTMIWFPIVYFIGNVMWHPATGSLNGIQDAMFNWYYGHNVLGLWFTTLGIPAVYYAIPRIIKRPLYSHSLSLISFFSIAFFYTGVGSHHLLQAPIPEWAKTIAVVMTILMMVPVLAFATNIMLTMKGSWKKAINNPVLLFILFGFINYVLTSIQGSMQGVPFLNDYLHFSQWTVGHAHLALLGGFGFMAIGLGLWIVPQVLESRIYSRTLMNVSWWTVFTGFFFFFWAMLVTGIVANANWWVHINVVETLPALRIPYVIRAMAGGVVVVGAYMVAINVVMTFIKRRAPLPVETTDDVPTQAITTTPQPQFSHKTQRTMNLPIIFSGGMAGLAAGDVTISVDVSNFELVDQEGKQDQPGKGHIIYYMDVPVPSYYEHTAISKDGTYAISSNTSYTWKDVTPGEHTFAAQLVNNNDGPLPAAVISSSVVKVGPPVGNPELQVVTPEEGSELGPGNIIVAVSVNNFIISQKDMGAINRKGEGHLVYYIDEEPPVTLGEPALTDTCVVSTDLNHLWKDVREGKHVLSVQLVNNNDTPLDVPVILNISIEVKA